ncbi:MAG: hypothetical protein ACF8LK_06550 [Phycisphaerales bacterium JB041]
MRDPNPIHRALTDPWCPAADVVAQIKGADSAREAMRAVAAAASGAEPLERARLARLADVLARAHPDAEREWQNASAPATVVADAIAQLVGTQVPLPTQPARAAIVPGQMVVATSPVRVDLAGGWSDTPPICHELGGTVVNAAVSLGGRQPLQAVAQLSDEPVVRITSIDLGRSVEFACTEDLLSFRDTLDWSAIPKAALVLSGLVPADASVRLEDWLAGVGGGVRLTVFAAVPKGSGLGTSSILGATVLAALSRLVGDDAPIDELTARTSMLEQLMRTGGGWQDQLGGVVPGCKILRTEPGPVQRPVVEAIEIPGGARRELDDRMILYYTGLQRLAANILQNVVGRYLARDPECVSIVRQLKSDAERMRTELATGDIDAFARTLGDYWTLKQRLDAGASTPQIEALLDAVRHDLAGFELPGAGGGGFLLLVARDASAAARVRDTLDAQRPNRTARRYEAAIDARGLFVSVV